MVRIVSRIIRIVTRMVRIITRITRIVTRLIRKWNYPNRKWNYDYFSNFQASDKKTPFTKCFTFDPRGSKLIFKTGNGIIQTGHGIISLTSKPLIKKLLLQNVSHLIQGVQNWFQNRKWNYPNRKWNYFSNIQASDQKTSFLKMFLIYSKELKIYFQNRKWNSPNRKWKHGMKHNKRILDITKLLNFFNSFQNWSTDASMHKFCACFTNDI